MQLAINQTNLADNRVRVQVKDSQVVIDPGCDYCLQEVERGNDFFPRHDARSSCQSGGRPHCSCESCF